MDLLQQTECEKTHKKAPLCGSTKRQHLSAYTSSHFDSHLELAIYVLMYIEIFNQRNVLNQVSLGGLLRADENKVLRADEYPLK